MPFLRYSYFRFAVRHFEFQVSGETGQDRFRSHWTGRGRICGVPFGISALSHSVPKIQLLPVCSPPSWIPGMNWASTMIVLKTLRNLLSKHWVRLAIYSPHGLQFDIQWCRYCRELTSCFGRHIARMLSRLVKSFTASGADVIRLNILKISCIYLEWSWRYSRSSLGYLERPHLAVRVLCTN